jgi:hypothetical protein
MVNLIIHRSLLRGMHGHSAKSCSGIKTNALTGGDVGGVTWQPVNGIY